MDLLLLLVIGLGIGLVLFLINSANASNRRELNQSLKDSTDSIDRRLLAVQQTQQDSLDKMTTRVEDQLRFLQKDNRSQLDKIRQTVDEKLQTTLEKRFSASFKQVDDKLKTLHEGLGEMRRLAGNVGDLQRTLTNVSSRGAWGEAQLGSLLADILNPDQYQSNFRVRESTQERVEFAVKLPLKDGQTMYLPIDAKFPLDRYEAVLAASQAGDGDRLNKARKDLVGQIKKEARSIGSKYVDPPLTTNFAILYLPAEGLFAEVVQQPGLVDEIRRQQRVVITGPTTITAVLGMVQIAYQTLAIEQRTGDIWNRLTSLREDFSKFGDLLSKAGKKITEAGNVIETAGSKQRNIAGQLNRLGNLSPKESDSDPVALVGDGPSEAKDGPD